MKRQIVRGLAAAAFIIAAALVLRRLHSSDEVGARAVNVTLGLLVVWIGANVPKQREPLSATACSPGKEQRVRRTNGSLVVGGGLIYTLAWLAAPSSLAFYVSVGGLGAAVMLVLTQCFISPRRGVL